AQNAHVPVSRVGVVDRVKSLGDTATLFCDARHVHLFLPDRNSSPCPFRDQSLPSHRGLKSAVVCCCSKSGFELALSAPASMGLCGLKRSLFFGFGDIQTETLSGNPMRNALSLIAIVATRLVHNGSPNTRRRSDHPDCLLRPGRVSQQGGG